MTTVEPLKPDECIFSVFYKNTNLQSRIKLGNVARIVNSGSSYLSNGMAVLNITKEQALDIIIRQMDLLFLILDNDGVKPDFIANEGFYLVDMFPWPVTVAKSIDPVLDIFWMMAWSVSALMYEGIIPSDDANGFSVVHSRRAADGTSYPSVHKHLTPKRDV